MKSKRLLHKLKHPAEQDMFCFFFQMKNLWAEPKGKHKKLQIAMCWVPKFQKSCTQFPAIIMWIWGFFYSNEWHMVPPHFFPQGLKVNSAAYIKVLDTVKLWIIRVKKKSLYIFKKSLYHHIRLKLLKNG